MIKALSNGSNGYHATDIELAAALALRVLQPFQTFTTLEERKASLRTHRSRS
jgi:hypothetical protein